MAEQSAGILLYRLTGPEPEVLLVHPGGPFWAKKDDGAWSIPKGLYEPGEEPLAAARREFAEETGPVPSGDFRSSARFCSRAARPSRPMRSPATSSSPASAATSSRWSGRRNPAAGRASRRPIGRAGSRWRKLGARSPRDRLQSSKRSRNTSAGPRRSRNGQKPGSTCPFVTQANRNYCCSATC